MTGNFPSGFMIFRYSLAECIRKYNQKNILKCRCLIAAYAILNNIQIFHKDHDFELISHETKLRAHKMQAHPNGRAFPIGVRRGFSDKILS
jgi:hypothetical protein